MKKKYSFLIIVLATLSSLVGFATSLQSSTSTPAPLLCNSNQYAWITGTTAYPQSNNPQIAIPSTNRFGFTVKFTANPTRDMRIGLYSSNWRRGHANAYPLWVLQAANASNLALQIANQLLGAVIEFNVGPGGNNTIVARAEAKANYAGSYPEGWRSTYSPVSGTVPLKGTNLTYLYTVIFSKGASNNYNGTTPNGTLSITLSYLDPTTQKPTILIQLTNTDFAYTTDNTKFGYSNYTSPMAVYIEDPSSAGFSSFTNVGFASTTGTNVSYSVSNLSINAPAAENITMAQTACSTALTTDINLATSWATSANAELLKLTTTSTLAIGNNNFP
ncbi:MAG: hypothetical protein QG604_175, partial [Candidatus Dependentiae bacterium]|nr:hypothetical protein [Candidatus Dependentiae bacterium]